MDREHADILIGIPSYNEADNISFVAHQVAEGLKRYFPNYSSMIVNMDNSSEDGTRETFLSSQTGDVRKKYISTPKGIKGKGNNLRNLFKEVEQLDPRAIIVVDADLKSITPEWVKILTLPILNGYDYVTPIYSRNKYDGTITNHICYPLLYSLFNTNIRQPIGGEFSFSPEMVKLWLKLEWKDCIREYGIDIFMTTSALLNGFKRCQVILGSKIHKPSAPKLGPMFTQVVTTLFDSICRFKNAWIGLEEIKDSPLFGKYSYQEPQPMGVDYEKLMRDSLEGFKKYNKILLVILSPAIYQKLNSMYEAKRWNIDSELWTKVLYDFIISYDMQDNRALVIDALKPLYFARVASYYKKTLDISSIEAEDEFQTQAEQFRRNKQYLVEKVKKLIKP